MLQNEAFSAPDGTAPRQPDADPFARPTRLNFSSTENGALLAFAPGKKITLHPRPGGVTDIAFDGHPVATETSLTAAQRRAELQLDAERLLAHLLDLLVIDFDTENTDKDDIAQATTPAGLYRIFSNSEGYQIQRNGADISQALTVSDAVDAIKTDYIQTAIKTLPGISSPSPICRS